MTAVCWWRRCVAGLQFWHSVIPRPTTPESALCGVRPGGFRTMLNQARSLVYQFRCPGYHHLSHFTVCICRLFEFVIIKICFIMGKIPSRWFCVKVHRRKHLINLYRILNIRTFFEFSISCQAKQTKQMDYLEAAVGSMARHFDEGLDGPRWSCY